MGAASGVGPVMQTVRVVSVGLVVVGLLTGTIADRVIHLEPLMLAGFRVLAVDFHTHSSMWSDGAFTPWGLALEAERQGLDAIAVTGHNQVSDGQLARKFSRAVGGPIVIGGEEVLADGSYHMIAAGVRDVVDFRQSAVQAIEEVHRQGGVTIAAHPFPDFVGWDDAAMQRLDGGEICHPNILGNPQAQRDLERFAGRQPIAAIGSSDFHGLGQMGVCRTFVFATDATEPAILDAVRAHRTVVFGLEGKVYGDPQLTRYADRLHTRIPSSDSRGSALDWISRSAALLGFAGLLLL